ncbi:MAG: DMT family transporter, partial [Planctomycetia bacterium]
PSIAFYRAAFAGLFLMAVLRLGRRPVTWSRPMIGMACCFVVMNYTFITAMTLTSAANVVVLQYTAPLWMVAGSVLLLGEPLDRRGLWTTLGAMVGVAVLLVGQWGGGTDQNTGVVLALVSGLAYAGVAVFLRRLREHDALWLATLNHLATAVVLAGLVAVGDRFAVGPAAGPGPFWTTRPAELALLAAFGVFQMGAAYVLFAYGLQRISPQEAGLLTLLEPVLTPVWAYAAAGEQPAASTFVGGGVLLSVLASRYIPAGRRRVSAENET